MSYCPKCGARIGEKDRFCAKCGLEISKKIPAKKLGDTKLKWKKGFKKAEVTIWKAICILSIIVGSISLGMAVFLSMLPKESLPVELWQLAGATAFFVVVGIIFLATAPFEYLYAKHLAEKLERTEALRKEA